MSFSTETKLSLIAQPYKNACCRRTLLNGILFAKGFVRDESVCVLLENGDVLRISVSQLTLGALILGMIPAIFAIIEKEAAYTVNGMR